MRASIAAEAVGIASVSLVCEGFERQGAATGRGLGFDGLPLAVLDGHVDSQSHDRMIEAFVSTTIDQITDGLTTLAAAGISTSQATSEPSIIEPQALDIVASGDIDEIHRHFVEEGWTDGQSIMPPTRARVEAFIEGSGHDPWKQLGIARPSGRDITIWSIAVNAVMAGCRPDHLPVLIAMAEILADPHYGAEHSGNTTGADALVILDGPAITELGFNAGAGALREGVHANTSVGRWLRLYLRNVFDFTGDEHDKATFGNSARVVLAEDRSVLDEIGWPSVSEDFGLQPAQNAAVMARMNSGAIVGSVYGSTPEEILPYLADGLVRVSAWDLTHVYGLGQGQFRPLLILSPVLARIFTNAGWSKDDVRLGLYQHARIPAAAFERYIGQWTNLTAGRQRLVDLAEAGHVPPDFGGSDDPDRLVPIVTEPNKFVIAVSGDPNRTNAYAMSNDGPHGDWTAKPIDLTPATDLICEVP